MTLKRLAFPLAEDRPILQERWWHRLCVVLFVVCLFLGLAVVLFFVRALTPAQRWSITILENLKHFSAQSDAAVPNAVLLFLQLGGQLGCLEDKGDITALSSYTLRKSYCSADIASHIEEAAQWAKREIPDYANTALENIQQDISEVLAESQEKRSCFISKDIECSSDRIIMYKLNIFYYLQVALYALLATYMFSLFLQLTYFKGLIYIIYGRYRKPNSS